jgi:hypothetical protein
MANLDNELLNRTLQPGQEAQAASGLIADKTSQPADDKEDDESGGGTPRQNLSMAHLKKEAEDASDGFAVAGGGPPSALNNASAAGLKFSWLNLLDSFGATLVFINLFIFGRLVLGEKFVCDLGEEWIPSNMRTGALGESLKSQTKTLGLVEKILLIILDIVALIILLALIYVIYQIVQSLMSVMNYILITTDSYQLIHSSVSF